MKNFVCMFVVCVLLSGNAMSDSPDTSAAASKSVSEADGANSDNESDANNFGGSEGTLDEIEVLGSRIGKSDLSLPANSSFIGSREISESGANSVPELLTQKTSVRLVGYTGNPSDGNLAMRGFGDNSQLRVAVLVDGIRYNRADMNSIPWLQLPVANLESVELIRGGNSARYGNNALAGVIKVSTRDMSREDALNITGMYGSYDTYSAGMFGSLARGDYFASAFASRFYTGGYRDYSESWANNFGGSLGYRFNECNTFTLAGNFSDTYTEYPNGVSYSDMQNDPQNAYAATTIYECKAYNISGVFDRVGARGEGYATLSFNSYDRDIYSSSNGKPKQNNQITLSFSSEYEIEVASDWRVYAGLEAQYTDIFDWKYKDASVGTAQFSYRQEDSDISRVSIGAHAGAIYEITEDLSLDFCGRFDAARTSAQHIRREDRIIFTPPYYEVYVDEADSYDDSVWLKGLAGSIALNWRIDSKSSVYAKFDQLFRYPSTDEIALYQGYLPAQSIKFNKDLKPEMGQNFEMGFKHEGEHLRVNTSIYALLMEDEIMYFVSTTPGGDTVNDNLPNTLRLGADIGASYNLDWGGIFCGASVVDAQFVAGSFNGNAIPLVPLFNGFAGIYLKPHERVLFTAQANYTSTQYEASDLANDDRIMPDYLTLDLRLNIKCCDYAAIFLAVENVLDERYALVAVSGTFYPAMGRMFKAGLNFKF